MTCAPNQPPEASELLRNPGGVRALDEAWADSQIDDSLRRHEEGGWIYMNVSTGSVMTRRAPAGGQAMIDLGNPPLLEDCVVVGKFHTHPNPSAEGWSPGPSASDQAIDERRGVPDLIRADDGVHLSGPECRRGGFAGEPGYPA